MAGFYDLTLSPGIQFGVENFGLVDIICPVDKTAEKPTFFTNLTSLSWPGFP